MSVDTLEFSNVTRDETPPQEFEYACVVCGREIFYGGRGRKPKYCDEHRTGNSPNKDSVRSKTKITGGTAQLAAQATEALIHHTSSLVAESNTGIPGSLKVFCSASERSRYLPIWASGTPTIYTFRKLFN